MRAFAAGSLIFLLFGSLWSLPVQAGNLINTLNCPSGRILCLEEVGYNFRECGTLTGMHGQPQEFQLCRARDEFTCVPCWFPTVAETSALCAAKYGPDCSAFTEVETNWNGEWSGLDWPDLPSPFSLLH
jgi:hypothetical protein